MPDYPDLFSELQRLLHDDNMPDPGELYPELDSVNVPDVADLVPYGSSDDPTRSNADTHRPDHHPAHAQAGATLTTSSTQPGDGGAAHAHASATRWCRTSGHSTTA